MYVVGDAVVTREIVCIHERAPSNGLGARTPRVSYVIHGDWDVLVGAYTGTRPAGHAKPISEIVDVCVPPSGPWIGVAIGTQVVCMNYEGQVVVAVHVNIEGDSRVRHRIEGPGPVRYRERCNASIVAVVAS